MKVWLRLAISLVATLGGWTSIGWAGQRPARLQTAQPSCPDDSGAVYVDCGNGTVTDNRSGLVWLADGNCLNQAVDWPTAASFAAGLSDKPARSVAAAHDCGLSDGSSPGEWRLPSVEEWEAMIADALGSGEGPDCAASPPTITNDSGMGCWISGPSAFSGVEPSFYWASNRVVDDAQSAWGVSLVNGSPNTVFTTAPFYVWPVRGGP